MATRKTTEQSPIEYPECSYGPGNVRNRIRRDEYYYPDTEDRGIAELIVTSHRNGPVGTVKMLFEPQFGRYRNLAA